MVNIVEKTITLNNGKKIPLLGLGTFSGERKGDVVNAVKVALNNGYKHIDCAAVYGNEKEIGIQLKEIFNKNEIKRKDIHITSKLWNSCHDKELVYKHCKKTLDDLNLEYLDLYLIHWPVAFQNSDPLGLTTDSKKDENGKPIFKNVPLRETWEEMEKLVEMGLVKSIGVSNFNVQSLIDLLSYAKIKPVINQVELHPYLSQLKLKDFCDKNNIILTAYSPLGQNKSNILTDPILVKIAEKYKKPVANVIFRWCIQNGFVVIPKSNTESRIIDNINVFDFQLSNNEMDMIKTLNKGNDGRTFLPCNLWGIPIFD
ncbi:hypothetical protein ACTA71_011967 [Dictyostelium dimigraforme]